MTLRALKGPAYRGKSLLVPLHLRIRFQEGEGGGGDAERGLCTPVQSRVGPPASPVTRPDGAGEL
ncbi:hypothetical protein E4099_01320 [Streptomyces palmae]|uniref:Uncharacterized protein n=1 Tax=Streptomyces palmae TaxID=1701085 RepID=A0A4Z0HDH7_9ACTN|nr:hypothetical protein E4099_01320 [Streptomyces palmae]